MDNENLKEEKPQIDPIQLIKERFSQYQHSFKVLTRAVKSCHIPLILEYLSKRLEEEPKWENRWNIVYGILTNKDLPKCKFCDKQLSFTDLIEGKQYCSELCEQASTSIKDSVKKNTKSKTKTKVVTDTDTNTDTNTNTDIITNTNSNTIVEKPSFLQSILRLFSKK